MLSGFKSKENYNLNCNGIPLTLDIPKIMGILNLTPDSFYKNSRASDLSQILDKVDDMLKQGMDILDVGAVSSRPGALHVSLEEEINRLIIPLKAIRKRFPELIISVDTFRSEVLQRALESDINIVNDISGLTKEDSDAMISLVVKHNLPYILMHMQGSPQTMQDNPLYKNVILELLGFFKEKVYRLKNAGVKDIILDPGFGFGKKQLDNYEILRKLSTFGILDCPLLIGLSRKSMIHKILEIKAEEALNGTTALHMAALLNGAHILRVHDISAAKECITLYNAVNGELE